ncbi:MAG: DNA-3-methyladenine glycosylase family protein [Gaiellaceae bacterium]
MIIERQRFALRPRPPFRLELTVWALHRRDQNAIDTWDGRTYRRVLLVKGAPLELAVTQAGPAGAPRLEVVASGMGLPAGAGDAARSALMALLGLEIDLSAFYARAARDRTLLTLVDHYRGVKPCLLNAVACQQLSLAAGLSLLSRLAVTAAPSAGTLHAFPAPAHVLGLPRSRLRTIGFSERKAETLHELADAAVTSELEFGTLERLDDTAVAEKLMRRRGIGRWSADYVLLLGLGRLHVFPRGDIGAQNGLRAFLAAAEVDQDPDAVLARWAPDAGMVYFHLLLRGLERQGPLAAARDRGRTPTRTNVAERRVVRNSTEDEAATAQRWGGQPIPALPSARDDAGNEA